MKTDARSPQASGSNKVVLYKMTSNEDISLFSNVHYICAKLPFDLVLICIRDPMPSIPDNRLALLSSTSSSFVLVESL